MTQTDSVAVAYDSLFAQRLALVTSAGKLSETLRSIHDTETGICAPLGRTSLRDLLESAIGETEALISLCADDVLTLSERMYTVENQARDLDLRLGSGWEQLPA